MSQMTIYLDNELEVKVKQNVAKMGLSMSQFVTRLIRKELENKWSPQVRELSGSWDSFPSIEEIHSTKTPDIQRESF
ncbi:MAG: hypothetical protein ACXWB0_06600 [Sulfuricurvum sp.]